MVEDDVPNIVNDEIVDQDEPEVDPFDTLLDRNPQSTSTQMPITQTPEIVSIYESSNGHCSVFW